MLAQPKRIALLAYLALEGARGFVPRERIMSVLWPESDATRARQSLRNALYQLRQSLGGQVLVNRGATDVALDVELFSVDVLDFKDAVSNGRFTDAAELYRGPFLQGFHLDENREFEVWMSRVAATLRGDALRALRGAAREHEEAGDIEGVRSFLRRAQAMAPRDEEILRHRLQLLARLGNRGAALGEGQEWIRELRSSLGSEPSEATLRLIEELRTEEFGSSEVRQRRSRPAPVVAGTTQAPRRTRWGGGSTLVGAVLGAAALTVVAWATTEEATPLPPVERGVIIEWFDADGVAGGQAAGVALGELTARVLDSGGAGLVLPREGVPAASLDGIERRLISGRLSSEAEGWVAEASLATTARPEEILARATASVDRFDLETLAVRLVDELGSRVGRPLASPNPVPPLSTVPAAVLPFYEGEVLMEVGRRPEARGAYERALAFDSTFAMAHFRLSMLLQSMGLREEAVVVSDRAVALSSRMTEAERQHLDAWRVYEWGNVEQALPMYQALVASRGPDPDVWITVAEIRFHWGPQLGVPREAADSAFRALLAITPGDVDALQHRLRLMSPVSSSREIDDLVERIGELDASDDLRMEAEAVSSLSKRIPLDERFVDWGMRGAFNFESRRLTQLAASARVPWDVAPFVRSLPPTEEPRKRVLRPLLLAQLAASSGRMSEAREELAALAERYPDRALEYRIALELASPVEPPRDTLLALRDRLHSVEPTPGPGHALMEEVAAPGIYRPRAMVLDAMLARALGEPIDAAAVMARAGTSTEPMLRDYARYVEFEVLRSTDSHERLLGVMGPGRPEGHRGRPDPLSYLVGTSRWARIESLIALGREDDALRWLGTFPDVGGYDLVYLAEASLLTARILERRGRLSDAAWAYERAAELWDGADPEFDSLVDEARRGVERTGGVSEP